MRPRRRRRPRHSGARAAGWLRKHEPFPAWARRVGAALSEEEAEACEARRLEILAAWDRWQATRHDVEVGIGHAAAGEASDAAAELVVTPAAEIAASRPRTLAGLRAFGAWFGGRVAADDLHDGFLERLAEAVAGFGGVAS